MAAAGFLSCYLNDPLPYIRRHITVNKTHPSFIVSDGMHPYHCLSNRLKLKAFANLETLFSLFLNLSELLVLLSLPASWPLEITAYSVLLPAEPIFPISTVDTRLCTVVTLAIDTTDRNKHVIFCPWPKCWHLRQYKGLGIKGPKGILRKPAFIDIGLGHWV